MTQGRTILNKLLITRSIIPRLPILPHSRQPFSGASPMAKFVKFNDEGLDGAAQTIREGGLVAFPTETVYGLGANALDESAVLSIFHAKGRPLTDPLIVHTASTEQALELVDLEGEALAVFRMLGDSFWPGGLTIVAPAKDHVPRMLGAGTGTVGVRVPAHPIANELIRRAQRPIAAPSANRFGHVSPTRAEHVMSDLGDSAITIINGDEVEAQTCRHGIESTVCKIDSDRQELIVYRRGATSEADLTRALERSGFPYTLRVVKKHVPMEADGDETQKIGEQVGEEAPGQLITHYAPDVPAFLLRRSGAEDASTAAAGGLGDLKSTVLLDFKQQLLAYKDQALAYRDLSPEGNSMEAAHNLFASLRWTEQVEGAQRVFIVDIEEVAGSDDEQASSVADRAFRATSGRVVSFDYLAES